MNLSHVDNPVPPELLQFSLGNEVAMLYGMHMHHAGATATLRGPDPLTLQSLIEHPPAQISHLTPSLLPVLRTVGERDEPATWVTALLPGDDAGANPGAPYTTGLTPTRVTVSRQHTPAQHTDQAKVLQPARMYRIGAISHPPIHSKSQEKRDSCRCRRSVRCSITSWRWWESSPNSAGALRTAWSMWDTIEAGLNA